VWFAAQGVKMLRLVALNLLLAGVSLVSASGADALSIGEESNLPSWVLSALQASKTPVLPCSRLNPFYQRGDFDGDGRQDHAVTVRDPVSGKRGIAFIHGGMARHIDGTSRATENHAWSVRRLTSEFR
jgi:hypothetical protein